MSNAIRQGCLIIMLGFICLSSSAQIAPGREWIDREYRYKNSIGNVVVLQNSLPKGGGGRGDQLGKVKGYTVFWTEVKNESDKPMELSIDLPEGIVQLCPSLSTDARIILPPETMHSDKIPMYDYGLAHLKTYVDPGFRASGKLTKTIGPNNSFMFYVLVLFYYDRQLTRAGFELKGNELFYKIREGNNAEPFSIPCGHIRFMP